ncbi:MAG: hypothetical protein WCL61_01510 [bacterium]
MELFYPKLNKLIIETSQQTNVGRVFISKVENKKTENRLGILFGFTELNNLPDNFNDEFLQIISDLETEYYLPPLEAEYGVEKRLEECLQRSNRRIDKLIKKSIADIELKNINVLAGLIHRNKIYLSQIGVTNAMLFHKRNDKTAAIIDIIDQVAEKKSKINQEKMFSNIISGEISIKDNLCFCNDSIMECLSQNSLSEIIINNPSSAAISYIETKIHEQKETGQNYYLVAIQPIISVQLTPHEVPTIINVPKQQKLNLHPEKSITNLMNIQENTEKYLNPSPVPNWEKVLITLLVLTKKGWKFTSKKIKSLTLAAFKQLKHSWKAHQEKKKSLAKIEVNTNNKELEIIDNINIPEEIQVVQPEQPQETTNISSTTPEDITKETKKIANLKINWSIILKLLPKKLPGFTWSQTFSDWLNKQIANFINLNKKQQFMAIAVGLLLFGFSLSIVITGQKLGSNQDNIFTTKLQAITNALENAEANNILNNNEIGAKEKLSEAVTLLAQLPKNKKYTTSITAIQNRIDDLNQALQKISYLTSPTVLVDFGITTSTANIAGFTKINNIFIAFDNSNNNLYTYTPEKKLTQNYTITDNIGNIKKIYPLTDSNSLLLLNEDNTLYQINLKNATVTKKVLTLESVDDLTIYGGKIYSLQSAKNQIFKHLPANNLFNSGSAWLKNTNEFSQSKLITINGKVITYSSNTLNIFDQGKKTESVNLTIDPPLKNPTQIFTETDSNNIYILDPQNQRLTIFNVNGSLKTQYTSKEFGQLKSMLAIEKEKKIYLLSDNKIFAIDTNY